MANDQTSRRSEAVNQWFRPSRESWWRLPFSSGTWRGMLFIILAVPVSLACVPLALLGRSQSAARLQKDLASKFLALRKPAAGLAAGRVIAHTVLSVPLSVASLLLTVYLWSLVAANLAYPLRPGTMESYETSWGGPTLAGAWAVHAVGGGLTALFLIPWVVRAVIWLHGRLAHHLLGVGR